MLSLPEACPDSPIFALLSTKPRELASHCQAAGFVVRALYPPTVPEGTERVRVCLHAGNTTEQIDLFVASVRQWIEAVLKTTSKCGTETGLAQDEVHANV